MLGGGPLRRRDFAHLFSIQTHPRTVLSKNEQHSFPWIRNIPPQRGILIVGPGAEYLGGQKEVVQNDAAGGLLLHLL
jgi:hypothetical protein